MKYRLAYVIIAAMACIGSIVFFANNSDDLTDDVPKEAVPLSESDIIDNSEIDFHSMTYGKGYARIAEDLTEDEKQQIWSFIEQLTFEETFQYEMKTGIPNAVLYIIREKDAVLIHFFGSNNIEVIYRHLQKVQLKEDFSNIDEWNKELETIVYHAERYSSDKEAYFQFMNIVGLYASDLYVSKRDYTIR